MVRSKRSEQAEPAAAVEPDRPPAVSTHSPGGLCREQQEHLCADYLDFAIRFLRKRFGDEGEEVAGEALWRAVQEYDGRIPFKAFLKQRLTWAGHNAIRAECGREGSARAEARRKTISLNAMAGESDGSSADGRRTAVPEPAAPPGEGQAVEPCDDRDRRMIEVLRAIQNLPSPGRQVVLCRFLGSMNLEQISHILGHRRRRLAAALAEVRQSVPLH